MSDKIKRGFVILLILCIFESSYTQVYAADESVAGKVRQISSVNQYNGYGESRTVGTPYGELLSSVDIRLKDKGGGTLGIYADLLCHEPMAKLRMWLYLEQWISEDQDWVTVGYEQFSWNAEDFPDQDLTMAVVSYNVNKLERGQDYRLRGMFGASALISGMTENWTIITPNFFLE